MLPIAFAKFKRGRFTPEKLKAAALSWIGLGLSHLLLPFFLARIVTSVLTVWRDIAGADVIAFYESGGFGHQICAPDVLRRLYPNKRILLFFAAVPQSHNWSLVRMTPIPKMVLLKFATSLKLGAMSINIRVPYSIQTWSCQFIGRVLRNRYPSKLHLTGYREIWRETWRQVSEVLDRPIAMEGVSEDDWLVAYFHLMRLRSAPPVLLDPSIAQAIRRRVAVALGDELERRRGICCLYLRERKGSVATSSRSGSDPDAYLPAIRYLNSRGYQCLITGDRTFAREATIETRGWLIDNGTLDIDPQDYVLFAASEADLFIGESGGGSFLAGINSIPTLLVNNLPIQQTRFRATVVCQIFIDQDGKFIEPENLFADYANVYSLPEGMIRTNTSDEIFSAVSEFVEGHRANEPFGIPIEGVIGRPGKLWYADAESRLSPAWLARIGYRGQQPNGNKTAGTKAR